MLDELFYVAEDFFCLGIIPGIILFIGVLVYCVKTMRYSVIISLLLAVLAGVAGFLISCLAIIIFTVVITISAGIGMIIGLGVMVVYVLIKDGV